MARSSARIKFTGGNKLYPISYALASLRAYPFRALSLALTLSLGVSLIGSAMIWADTGVQVSINEYFAENTYQMLLESGLGSTEEANRAEDYLRSSDLIETTRRVNSTIGLVYGTYLPDTTIYGIDEPIYTYGMKDCEVIFVDNGFLAEVEREFSVAGAFRLAPGEVLISRQFANFVFEVFGITLFVNSTLDFEILTRRHSGAWDELGEMGRVSLPALRIAGIYNLERRNSLLETAFPSRLRQNYDFINFRTPVLGIRDSVMILSNSVDLAEISEEGFFGPQTFARASSTGLVASGPEFIAENLLTLKARLDEQFDVNVEGLSEIMLLQGRIDSYIATTPLAALNLPVFILALFLSVFAADTFMAARKPEVSALRAKGASSVQIYGVFISEAVFMAAVSIVVGMGLSVFFAALIPSTVSFMNFDLNLYLYFLSNTVLSPEATIYTVLLCIVPPLIFILNSARNAARTEIGATLTETAEDDSQDEAAYGFTLGLSVVLIAMVVASVLFLPPNPIMVMLELGLGTAAWFFLAYNGSRASRLVFARIASRLSFLLGEKNMVAAGNLRMRKGRVIPLMVVLSLTISSTIAFTVQAHTFHADLNNEIRYSVGADLRIACNPKPFSFTEAIEEYPGVVRATAIFTTWGQIGTEMITIAGVHTEDYSELGYFHETSFLGKDHTEVLSLLDQVENGILLSTYHAERWNKTLGDTINMDVGGRLTRVELTFQVVGFVHTAPGLGYASVRDMPTTRLGGGFGMQAQHSGFGLVNIDWISEQTDIRSASLFLADLFSITDRDILIRALHDLPGVSATTPEGFELRARSFGTAVFLSTVEGLFSIGFGLSLILGLFSLTLFLGSIVRERKRDYAILRAVGGSKPEVVRIVLAEFTGVVFASLILSLALGTVFGFVMSLVVFSVSPFSRALPAAMVFPIGFLTVIILLQLVAMIGGSYVPARNASKSDPAIVLRNL